MALGSDLSVYQNAKTLNDYAGARQQQADQAQQLYQQEQAQQLDLQSKKNIYATQVLSSAVDQPSYEMVRQHLNQSGIDTSGLANDFPTAQKQIYQARLAQSPLGSLLNAGMKAEGVLNQGASTFGTAASAAAQDPMSAAVAKGLTQLIGGQQGIPQDRPVMSDGRGAPSSNPPALPQQAIEQTQIPSLAGVVAPPLQATTGLGANLNQSAIPQQLQGETQQKYQNRLDNDPAVIQAKKAAEAAGTAAGAIPLKAATANAFSDRIIASLDAMNAANEKGDMPYSGAISANAKAAASLALGKDNTLGIGDNQSAYNAQRNFNEVQKQAVVANLQEMLSAAPTGSRMSQALIGLVNEASNMDPNTTQEALRRNIASLKAEVQNIPISEQNIGATINGGQQQPLKQIPMGAAPPLANGWSIKRVN